MALGQPQRAPFHHYGLPKTRPYAGHDAEDARGRVAEPDHLAT